MRNRDERPAAHGQVQAGDEEEFLVGVDPVDHRDVGEAARRERGSDRLRQDFAVDDAGDRRTRKIVDQSVDRHAAQALRGFTGAPELRGELFTEDFGVRERHLGQCVRTALDDRVGLEESASLARPCGRAPTGRRPTGPRS